jgi:AraC-like DNA-binding protein
VLRNFQVFDTRDPEEFASGMNRLVGAARFNLPRRGGSFHTRVRSVALGDVALMHGTYEAEIQLRVPDFGAFGHGFPVSGGGVLKIAGKEVTVSRGNGAITSPGDVSFQYAAGFEHLAVLIRPAALTSKLAALIGDLRYGPLQFEAKADSRDPQTEAFERLVSFVAKEFDLSWPMAPIVQSELQQAIMTSFLLANVSNYSELLHGRPNTAASWQVRRAEQFIEANWDRPITVEALAEAANVSERSLFFSFKAGRGYSPMEFVKRVRLGRAWGKLSKSDATTSVIQVAYDCGFGNPGHFAKDYYRHFGERPSETLRRARGAGSLRGPVESVYASVVESPQR